MGRCADCRSLDVFAVLSRTDAATRVLARRHARLGRLDAVGRSGASGGRLAKRNCDTSVILFWMWGGPSQLETFDMKPDAPSEYRGPLSPIRTNVPGIEICEYMPLLAQRADRFSLIRSLHHEMSAHNDGSIEVLTGKTPRVPDPTSQAHSEHPDFGMVAARLRGPRADGLPQYVGVQRAPFMTNPAYLGVAHRSFDTGDPSRPGFSPPNLTLVTGVDNQSPRQPPLADPAVRPFPPHGRRHRHHGRDRPLPGRRVSIAHQPHASPTRSTSAASRRRPATAMAGTAGARAACWPAGSPKPAPPSSTSMRRRRATRSKNFSWDDHAGAFHLDYAQRERLPQMDQALSALLDDMHSRSLNKRVLVLACGEFGRTPRVTHAPVNFSGQIGLGRDHWPQAFSALIAGGGLRMGQVVGETNSKSEFPLHDPVTPQDLMATVYRHLGIDPSRTFLDFSGRPVPLLFTGRPIAQLV